MHASPLRRPLLTAAILALPALAANAQPPMPLLSGTPQSVLGPRLSLDPWDADSSVESDSLNFVESQGHLKGDITGPFAPPELDTHTVAQHVNFSDIWGRVRMPPKVVGQKLSSNRGSSPDETWYNPALGFRWNYVDFGIHHPGLPSAMNDVALAYGQSFNTPFSNLLTLTAGAGYAGNSPFNDSRALYGIGHAALTTVGDGGGALVLSLDYNGNNAFLPDVPLPGIALYFGRFSGRGGNDNLTLYLGFPESSVAWRPTDRLVLEASWAMPYTAHARATFELARGVSLYGSLDNFFTGFHDSADSADRRFFFQQRRAEIGVRFVWEKWLDFSLGAGYAWDQQLFRGFDVRSLHDVATLEDAPYLALRLGGSF